MISLPDQPGFAFSASVLRSLRTAPVLLQPCWRGWRLRGSGACSPGVWGRAGQPGRGDPTAGRGALLTHWFGRSLSQSESKFSLHNNFSPWNTVSLSDSSAYASWRTPHRAHRNRGGPCPGSPPRERTGVLSNVPRGLQSVDIVLVRRNACFKQESSVLCSECHPLRMFGRETLTCAWSKVWQEQHHWEKNGQSSPVKWGQWAKLPRILG